MRYSMIKANVTGVNAATSNTHCDSTKVWLACVYVGMDGKGRVYIP
jgi:hypothetical protein